MSGVPARIAGIAIPDSALARDATEFVRDAAKQMLFDHSRRVFPGYVRPNSCDAILNSRFET
jgi:hypothetical protein